MWLSNWSWEENAGYMTRVDMTPGTARGAQSGTGPGDWHQREEVVSWLGSNHIRICPVPSSVLGQGH